MALRHTGQYSSVMIPATPIFTVNVQHGMKWQHFIFEPELVATFEAVYRDLKASLAALLFLKTGGVAHACSLLRAHTQDRSEPMNEAK